jgi:AraC-like DNA-binding protein
MKRRADSRGYELAAVRPYVRIAREEWRGPWLIAERRILDYLLVYITRGTGRFTVEGRRLDVREGDLLWIPPDTLHEMEGLPPKMQVAYVHFDLIHDPEKSPLRTITPGGTRDLKALRNLVHHRTGYSRIDAWCGSLPVVNTVAIYSVMKRLIVENLGMRDPLVSSGLMLQLIGEIERGLSPGASRAGAHWPAMQRAAEQILRGAEAPLDIPGLAHGAHLSVSHFRKLFRETHKQSPRTMHNHARIQKACELMLYSGAGWTLTRIAAQLGFSTVHNLSRAFRRTLGLSPLAYKRRHLSTRTASHSRNN